MRTHLSPRIAPLLIGLTMSALAVLSDSPASAAEDLPTAQRSWQAPVPEEAPLPGELSLTEYARLPRWSPYLVGAGIGILSWLAFLLSAHPLGASTAYARSSGMLEVAARGDKAKERAWYEKKAPTIDWEWMLVIGAVLGALLSAWLGSDLTRDWTPPLWQQAFGDSVLLRVAVALVGGAFLGFGSRWAGGCTSGHGISGTSQLVLSSWLAAICFFVSGVATAFFLYYVLA